MKQYFSESTMELSQITNDLYLSKETSICLSQFPDSIFFAYCAQVKSFQQAAVIEVLVSKALEGINKMRAVTQEQAYSSQASWDNLYNHDYLPLARILGAIDRLIKTQAHPQEQALSIQHMSEIQNESGETLITLTAKSFLQENASPNCLSFVEGRNDFMNKIFSTLLGMKLNLSIPNQSGQYPLGILLEYYQDDKVFLGLDEHIFSVIQLAQDTSLGSKNTAAPNNLVLFMMGGINRLETCLFEMTLESLLEKIPERIKNRFINQRGLGKNILDIALEKLHPTNIDSIKNFRTCLRLLLKDVFYPDLEKLLLRLSALKPGMCSIFLLTPYDRQVVQEVQECIDFIEKAGYRADTRELTPVSDEHHGGFEETRSLATQAPVPFIISRVTLAECDQESPQDAADSRRTCLLS